MSGDRVYRILLSFYPASFRARFGDDMRRSFGDDCARARAGGRRSVAAFWIRTIAEAVLYGTSERFTPAAERHRVTVRAKGQAMKSGFFHDCRDAFRAWRATPLVTTVAVVSLALGIGANTALFSILNGLVLKPLPVRQPDALAYLDGGEWTNPIWEEIRARQHELFDGAFAWSGQRFNLADQGLTDMVPGAYASGDTFDVLGVAPSLGRLFRSGDDVRGGGPDGAVAVISDRLWHQRFDASPAAVGRRLSLNGIPFTIVGVMPPGFFGPDVGTLFDVIVPLGDEALIRGAESALSGRQSWWIEIMVRRKPGQSLEQATAALRAAQPQIRAAALPASVRGAKNFLAEPFSLVPAAEATRRSENGTRSR